MSRADRATQVLDVMVANTGALNIPKFSDFVLHDNPLQQPAHVLENKSIYWQTLAQTLEGNPTVLVGTMQRYMTDVSARVFACFPIRIDTRGKWRQNIIEFAPNWVAPSTMKVPPREITYTVDTREHTAMYAGEGFEADYSQLKTPEGMAFFDMMFGQVVSDVMRVIVYNMYQTFMEEQSAYISPLMRFPYEARIPNTPQEAFDYFFRTQALALNREPQMIHNLIAHCNRMFEAAREPGVALIVMSEEVKRYIRQLDETMLYYEDTGPTAVGNRTESVNTGSIRNVEVLTIQMLGEDNDNIHNKTLFTDRWQMGSLARFVEPSVHVCPSKYSSTYRNGRWSSWYSDKPEEHSFMEGLRHLMEFVPLDYVPQDGESVSPGELDTRLLFQLADANGDNRMFSTTRCRYEGNQDALHQFLKFIPGTDIDAASLAAGGLDADQIGFMTKTIGRDRYMPAFVFGEIAPRFVSDGNLRLPYATMRMAITSRLAEEEIVLLEEGFALAKRLANPPWVPNLDNLMIEHGAAIPGRFGTTTHSNIYMGALSFQSGTDNGFWNLDNFGGAVAEENPPIIPYGLGTYDGFRALLTARDLNVDANIMNLIDKFVPAFEKLVTVLIEINKTHPALDPDNVPSFHKNASTFERICIAAWNNLIEGGRYPHLLSPKGAGPIGEQPSADWKTAATMNMAESGVKPGAAYTTPARWARFTMAEPAMFTFLHFDIDETGAAKNHAYLSLGNWSVFYNDALSFDAPQPQWHALAARANYDLIMAQDAGRVVKRLHAVSPWSDPNFARRWNAARGAPTWDRLARFTVLLQEINLNGIQGWWDANVAIPLGLAMVRPFEEMITDSIVMTSQREVGFTAFSGLDNIASFDGNSQHYSVQVMGGFRTIVTNNKRFIVMDRVRGRRLVGGKGNRYINANPESPQATVMRVGSEDFEGVTRANFGNSEVLGQYSMIALLDGYNGAIDNPFSERHIPLTGFWDLNDFAGMLADSFSFQREYNAPLGINQFMFNFIFPELITNKPTLACNPLRATHTEIAEMWLHNTYVHQITQWVRNPLTGRWDEINSSHPCGREEDDTRGIQGSITPVRRNPRKANRGLPPLAAEVY